MSIVWQPSVRLCIAYSQKIRKIFSQRLWSACRRWKEKHTFILSPFDRHIPHFYCVHSSAEVLTLDSAASLLDEEIKIQRSIPHPQHRSKDSFSQTFIPHLWMMWMMGLSWVYALHMLATQNARRMRHGFMCDVNWRYVERNVCRVECQTFTIKYSLKRTSLRCKYFGGK